jgi:hypothetical protein
MNHTIKEFSVGEYVTTTISYESSPNVYKIIDIDRKKGLIKINSKTCQWIYAKNLIKLHSSYKSILNGTN